MRIWLSRLVVGCSAALSAFWSLGNAAAAPLDLKQVPADAVWVGHVDFDAVHASTVVQKIEQKIKEKHPEHEQRMGYAIKFLGMDPRKDLHGMTFYGSKIGKPEGAVVVHAKLDGARLMGLATKLPSHQAEKHGDHEVHSWTHKHHGHEHVIAAALCEDDRFVVGSSMDTVKTALDVIHGKAAATSAGGPLDGRIPPGTTVLLRVKGVSEAGLPCKSPLVKQTDSFRFVTGEADGKSFFRARAVMTNNEVTAQAQQVVEGGKALAMIHAGDDPRDKKLASALNVKAKGKNLTILWSAPADDVYAEIDEIGQKIEKHIAKMKAEGKMCCPLCGCHDFKHGKGDKHRDKKDKDGDEKSKIKQKPSKPAKPAAEDDF